MLGARWGFRRQCAHTARRLRRQPDGPCASGGLLASRATHCCSRAVEVPAPAPQPARRAEICLTLACRYRMCVTSFRRREKAKSGSAAVAVATTRAATSKSSSSTMARYSDRRTLSSTCLVSVADEYSCDLDEPSWVPTACVNEPTVGCRKPVLKDHTPHAYGTLPQAARNEGRAGGCARAFG